MRWIIPVLMLSIACDDGGTAAPLTSDATVSADAAALDAALLDAAPPDLSVDAQVDAAPPPPQPTDYCEATVDVFCPFYLRCGRMAVPDVETCRAVFLENCNAVYEPVYAALADAGQLALDPAAIARCGAHLDQVECSAQIFDLDGPCGDIWTGQAPADAPCGPGIESFVCAPGAACVLGLDFCGVCEAAGEIGAACVDEVRCVANARCVEGTCRARALPGAACGEAGCVLGARCVDGICAGPARAAVGESCANRERCPYKAECVGGVCVEAGRIGAPCDAMTPCASGACDGGVCVAPNPPGAPCEGGATCQGGICDGTCQPIPGQCFSQ